MQEQATALVLSAAAAAAAYCAHGFGRHTKPRSLKGLTVMITGCSRGLGLEMTAQLTRAGAKVVATCRKPAEAEALRQLKPFRVYQLDTASSDSLAKCFRELATDGILAPPPAQAPVRPRMTQIFGGIFRNDSGDLRSRTWSHADGGVYVCGGVCVCGFGGGSPERVP